MKKSLVLAMAMALGVTASAYAANPFSDVPAGHWAYDSVNKLVAAGVVDGYPDGTYGGDKLMTRYEMAQIVAKAMAKGADVDKLAAEFADELDTLGVRVANLEKKADNVKITGEIRYHYADHDTEAVDSKGVGYGNENKLRTRIWINGQINDDWTYTGMIQNEQDFDNDNGDENTDFQRAYVNGKLGGVKVQAGRYNLQLAQKNVYDHRFDGIQASYGKDVKLVAGYGKAAKSSTSHVAKDTYYAELSGNISKLNLLGGYYSFEEANYVAEDKDIWTVGATYAFDKNVKLGAQYLNGDQDGNNAEDDGYVITASYKGAKASDPGSWGLVANYYDQSSKTYVEHTMNGLADSVFMSAANEGFKGYSVFANYTFAKNIVGQVEWYDLEAKEGNVDDQTIWSQLLFTF